MAPFEGVNISANRCQHLAEAAKGLRACHEVGTKKGYGGFLFVPHGA